LLAKVRLDELLPLFGTTTHPDIFPDEAEKFKRDLQTVIERLKRRFPRVGLLWRLELKRRKSGGSCCARRSQGFALTKLSPVWGTTPNMITCEQPFFWFSNRRLLDDGAGLL
jgi:hypothetical protein